MRVHFWGTRGSIAAPGPATVRYGGNTSCVELRSADGVLIVLDCGTGARMLGRSLIEEAAGTPIQASLLLGHTHWDHIQGLPFFEALFGDARWDIYGPRGLSGTLSQTLAGQMSYEYFPVALHQLGAGVEFHELVEGTFEIDGVSVRTQYLNHPALTLGYRFECDGATVCYIADHEPFDPALATGGDVLANRHDARHVEFLRDADVVIHDAQYDVAEYAERVGWGHSTVDYVVDVCSAAGVGQTVLYHHDPFHDDDTVDAMVAGANERAAGRTSVIGAAEGAILEVGAPATRAGSRSLRAATARPTLGDLDASILVDTPDASLRAAVSEAAEEEHLPVRSEGEAVVFSPDHGAMVIVADVDQPGDRLDAVQATLPSGARDRVGILAVSRGLGVEARLPLGVTDWMVWPASVAHVRTKLRAVVLRQACRWLAAPRPADEEARLEALYGLAILDTPTDAHFDRFTDLAMERFGVPVAMITLVDRDRQWFKSRVGIEYPESHRDQSFCAHTILGPDVMQVPDAALDDRFADNPVVGATRLRFYAGAPLTLRDGSRVGTLCIADRRPRLLTTLDLDALRALADQVVDALLALSPKA